MTNRSPRAYARALNPGGTYVTVGGSISAPAAGHDPESGAVALVPVIDRRYTLADVPEALRRFGTGDHHGKIIVTMC